MISKEKANYRSAVSHERCGNCDMFLRASGECTLVRGAISPMGVCDYFEEGPNAS